MAEKRRLFINPNRLNEEIKSNGYLILTSDESHYLSRVMRMKSEELLEVVDGKGHLWGGKFVNKKVIKLTGSIDTPIQTVPRDNPLICIAVVIPKKGFDNFLQMSCEIGVDVIQPLISNRSVIKECSQEKIIRYHKIIFESVEQSERLWCPEVKKALKFTDWIKDLRSGSQIGFATTRIQKLKNCQDWLQQTAHSADQIWVVIGPEGGWSKDEETLAFESGLVGISFGKNILRTSTAAVSACQLMTSWRRLKLTI